MISKNSTYPTYISGSRESVSINTLSNASSFVELLPDYLLNNDTCVTNWMEYKGNTIKKDGVVVTFSELGRDFYLLSLIILIRVDDFLIVSKKITDVYLNEHVRAYI